MIADCIYGGPSVRVSHSAIPATNPMPRAAHTYSMEMSNTHARMARNQTDPTVQSAIARPVGNLDMTPPFLLGGTVGGRTIPYRCSRTR